MKKFFAFLMLLSLCAFTIGCPEPGATGEGEADPVDLDPGPGEDIGDEEPAEQDPGETPPGGGEADPLDLDPGPGEDIGDEEPGE